MSKKTSGLEDDKETQLVQETKLRNFKIKKGILYTIITKGGTLLLSFISMRLLFDYLGEETLGLWLTIFSILTWVALADIGIGASLRNRLGESLATNNILYGRALVSTSYGIIIVVLLIIYVLFLVLTNIISWETVFGEIVINQAYFQITLNLLIGLTLLNLMLQLFNQVALAHQDSHIPGIVSFISNLLYVITILFLPSNSIYSFSLVAVSYGLTTVITSLVISLLYYKKKYLNVAPSFRYMEKKHVSDLFTVGGKFFIIQIAVIIIFSTDNYIILRFLGPEEVVTYQVLFRLFSVLSIAHVILITPFWSAYTEAYVKNDFGWIKSSFKKMIFLLVPFAIALILLTFIAKPIINIWMGEDINFTFTLTLLFATYIFITIWNNVFAYFLNGISRINTQLICSIIGAIINIPLSIFFVTVLNMGVNGVLLASILSLLLSALVLPLDVFKVLKNKNLI